VAGGHLGVSSSAVSKYFKDLGYGVTDTVDPDKIQQTINTNTVSIMRYWNDKNNIFAGQHYVAIQPTANGIRVYNRYNKEDTAYDFDSVNAFVFADANQGRIKGPLHLFGMSAR
jgi:hypothetical protein